MNRMSKWLFVSVGLLVIVSVACASQSPNGGGDEAASSLTVGDPAPDFDLPTAAGGHVSIEDYRSKQPMLLYFSMGPG